MKQASLCKMASQLVEAYVMMALNDKMKTADFLQLKTDLSRTYYSESRTIIVYILLKHWFQLSDQIKTTIIMSDTTSYWS